MTESIPAIQQKGKPGYLAIGLIIVIVALAGFSFFMIYSQSNTITRLNTLNSGLASKLAAANSTIQNQQSTIGNQQSQLATDSSTISAQGSQITSYESQVGAMNSQISSLQMITNMSDSESLATDVTATETSSNLIPTIISYNAPYAGYLVITGSTSAMNGVLLLEQTISNTDFSGEFISGPVASSLDSNGYYLSGSFTMVIPVAVGHFTIYFGSSDAAYDSVYINSITYYY